MSVFVERTAESSGWHGGSADLASNPALAPPISPRFETTPRARRIALLNNVVLTEILPRLALSRRAADTTTPRTSIYIDTGEFVRLLLGQDAGESYAFVDSLLARGATPEALYTGILPDAARWLGLMWEEDRCDFTQVTIALGRLQHAARMLSPRFQETAVNRTGSYTLLLLPAAGEQHTFGLLILAEFFQRAGWRVAGGPRTSGVDVAELVRDDWFDVAGFSIGSESLLDGLNTTIRRVRRASRNRGIRVMAGGPLFQQRPDLAGRAGADAVATDAAGAVRLANDLLTMRAAAE
jgi:methanogenic corrinoid protein MtbC1